jgi:MinD-like ATPase involved in chromosome partitioning or flagellar assembly
MYTQSVATAIRSAEAEGFIAGTLFSQGWSVSCRALDFASLLEHVQASDARGSLLLISTDVDGFSSEGLDELKRRGVKYFLFAATIGAHEEFPESIAMPTTPLELLGIIRGSLRSPLIRPTQSKKPRSKIIGVCAASHALGCTTLAINIGAELAELGKKVLLVDAHSDAPAIALKMGERGLNSSAEIRSISNNLWAVEITQSEINTQIAALDHARSEFDLIVIDLGVLTNFSASLSGRRWSEEVIVWTSTHGDEMWVMAQTDVLGAERLRILVAELAQNSIKPKLSFLRVLRGASKRSKSGQDSFLSAVTSLRPLRVLEYPWDPRSAQGAEDKRTSLCESNERALLRKTIAEYAGELIS